MWKRVIKRMALTLYNAVLGTLLAIAAGAGVVFFCSSLLYFAPDTFVPLWAAIPGWIIGAIGIGLGLYAWIDMVRDDVRREMRLEEREEARK